MVESVVTSKLKGLEIQAVITRANGSIEKLGTISYWSSNPLKMIIWRIKQWLHS